jgi:hypothetical protein
MSTNAPVRTEVDSRNLDDVAFTKCCHKGRGFCRSRGNRQGHVRVRNGAGSTSGL